MTDFDYSYFSTPKMQPQPKVSVPIPSTNNDPDYSYFENRDQILKGNQVQLPPQSQTGFQRAADLAEQYITKPVQQYVVNPGNDFASGALQGIANIPGGAANLAISGANLIPGVNVPKVPMFDFAPDNPAAMAGNIASFFVPGGIAGQVARVPEYANAINSFAQSSPMLSKAANLISKNPLTSSTIGNSLLGGVYDPNNPGQGMMLGALARLALKGGETFNAAKNALVNNPVTQGILNKFAPEHYAQSMMDNLGNGAKDVYQNTIGLGSDVRNAYKQRYQQASDHFKPVFDKVGDDLIYEPLLKNTDQRKAFNFLDKMNDLDPVNPNYDKFNIGPVYHKFTENPSFSNAHDLQSEMGTRMRDIQSNPLKTSSDRLELSQLKEARDNLQYDMKDFLKMKDSSFNSKIDNDESVRAFFKSAPILSSNPVEREKLFQDFLNKHEVAVNPNNPKSDLHGTYNKGMDIYREHVSPYLADPKIRDVVRGNQEMVPNLHKSFENPSDFIKFDEEKIGPINKILNDLPQSSMSKILYNAVGGHHDSNAIVNSLDRLARSGKYPYLNREIGQHLNSLNSLTKNKKNLISGLKGAGAITGVGYLGSSLMNHNPFSLNNNH